MNDDQLDALLAAATDGISFDGLTVRLASDGYRWETPERAVTGISRAEAGTRARDDAPYVTNWDYWTNEVGNPDSARYAFLRWLERAEELPVVDRYDRLSTGMKRTWGQLSIATHRTEGGGRRYTIRHEHERAVPIDDLEIHHDPADARELARYDEDGRYRPLHTAPTLRSGWVFSDLSGDELVRAVETFYPATVANWHLERSGSLDVTHWRATANRQTGMYDVVDELPPEAVEWAARACCTDDVCLKRRRWQFDEERDLDVPAGDGEFPCREACSLFVAAAREWALAERETAAMYEFELTPGEKTQLEAILAAIAADRIDDIRAGALDDPANRYRVRYLYAKLFQEGEFDDEMVRSAEDADSESRPRDDR